MTEEQDPQADESAQAADEQPEQKADDSKGARAPIVLAVLAIVLALAAGAGAGYVWYVGQQRLVSVDERIGTLEESLQADVQEVILPRLRKLSERLDQQRETGKDRDETLAELRKRLERTRVQVGELSQLIQGGQRQWRLLEVESLLLAANERLLLYQKPESARLALELASRRLADLNDPRLFKIREQVVNEIAALKALPDPDVEGLALKLAALIDQARGLPLAISVPSDYQGETPGEDETVVTEPAWRHFLKSVREALDAMVTIRRTDREHEPLLPPEQEFFLYQNLLLKLQAARLALLQGRTQSYEDNLATAQTWLRTFFDTQDSAVKGAIDQLTEMRKVELSWQAPDITKSLSMLHDYMADRPAGKQGEAVPEPPPEPESPSGAE